MIRLCVVLKKHKACLIPTVGVEPTSQGLKDPAVYQLTYIGRVVGKGFEPLTLGT